MYRQSPSRNQRSKGIRVKNVLQICLLLAVCFWLIYQVKHSHDKKKEFEDADADAKVSLRRTSGDDVIRLGRKDIGRGVEETDSKTETSEEEETTGEEIEENKHDEDESEDQKVEEKEDDEAGGRDVETEEHEQDKSDSEIDREQGLVDVEEREDGEENGTRETDSEEGRDGQMEKESTVDDTDHDADDTSSHEAREEHYKADDASSAVTHGQTVTENDNEHVEDSNELPGNNLEEEKKENNGEETYEGGHRKDLEVEGNEAAGDGHQSNVTSSATEENMLHDSENGSTLDNEVTEGSTDHLTSNGTAELTVENDGLISENLTDSKPEISLDLGNVTDNISGIQNGDPEEANNSTDAAESHSEQLSDLSSNTTDSSASEDSKLKASTEEVTESSSEKNNEFEGEKSDSSDGADERLETTFTDNPEEVQEDAIDVSDTSISTLEKDIQTDIDALPEILTEGTNSEDAAAE